MNQYPVPQFIEREKKLLGPLSVKQSVILGAAGLIVVISYFLFPFFVFVIILILAGGSGISLSLLKVNGRPMSEMVFAYIQYFLQPKMYLFKKEPKKTKKNAAQAPRYVKGKPVAQPPGYAPGQAPTREEPAEQAQKGTPSEKQLDDLAKFLDT